MKTTILLTFLIALVLGPLSYGAEPDSVKHWKTKIETSLGLTQTTLTNWSKGGENSVSIKAMGNVYEDYAKGKFTWNNYLGATYLVQKQESFSSWRKADDKLNMFTKAGIYAWNHWDYTGLLEFKSQFAKGYSYPNDSVYTSKFLAPGYIQLSIGLNYKPVDYFSVLISPIGSRVTIVNDEKLSDAGAFGVSPGETALVQVGASVNALFKKDIFKNINLMSKLDLFSDYKRNPENIIVNWENILLMKVNKYISVNIATMLIYDDNIPYIDPEDITATPRGARTQFMETLSVGFAWSFIK